MQHESLRKSEGEGGETERGNERGTMRESKRGATLVTKEE